MCAAEEKNIILCGFMGCGKSSVGKLLARRIGRSFVDMDVYLEQREGRRIRDIFARDGEPYFRALESRAVSELAGRSGLVIAAGGGTFLREENVREAKRGGVILLLDVPLPAIRERLRGDKTRPLLQKENPEAEMERLYTRRQGAYRAAADLIIPAGAPARIVADRILSVLQIPTPEPGELLLDKRETGAYDNRQS